MIYVLSINPEPWAIGPLSVGRKGGKVFPKIGQNAQLAAFQQAVREAFAADYPDAEKLTGPVHLECWFWRRRDDYETGSGRRHRKHQADVTNLQKGLEDALQGILFDNDENVTRVESTMIYQGFDVRPCIAVRVSRSREINDVPGPVAEAVLIKHAAQAEAARIASDNTWGG